jgi:uncharacterized membrane protein|tara:strand:- start:314 stop:799 length:486 start_codon:yes stop_codon:yes gene_type:complete
MNRKVLLVTLLVFSIGLNLVFIGVAVGRHLFGMSPGRAHFEWMTQEVGEETRRKLRSSMREHMQESLPARIELRKAQHQLRSAITTDEYVETDVVARLAEIRRASADLQESMHKQMVKNLRQLAPEERSHVLGMMMKLQDNKGRRGPPPEHPRRPGDPPQG